MSKSDAPSAALTEDERKLLDDLKRENKLLKAAIQASPSGILIATAPDGVIEYWNPAALGTRKGTEADLANIPMEKHPSRWQTFYPNGDIYEPEDLPLSRALLHGEVVEGKDVIIRGTDGVERWVMADAAPIDFDGERIAGVVVFPDVTARKEAEERAERFRNMAELSPDFVGMATPDGQTLYINPAGRALCGIDDDVDVHQLRFADYLTEEAAQQVLEHALPVALAERRWRGESTLRHKDGSEVPVSQVVLAHHNAKGELSYYSTVMRDLRPIRALQAQLAESQRLDSIGRLAGGVAHDFNNMLTVIHNFVTLVAQTFDDDDERKDDLEQVLVASERSASLCRQLLSFARKQEIKPTQVHLGAHLAKLQQLLLRAVGEAIALEVRIDDDIHEVRVDLSQFDQVVLNLVVNAKDAMPDGGEVSVRVRNRQLEAADIPAGVVGDAFVELQVTDTGVGMADEVRARVFEPFFSTKAEHEGTGLGLSTVHGAVHQNGGFVIVNSEVGKGTQFSVFFPAVSTGDK